MMHIKSDIWPCMSEVDEMAYQPSKGCWIREKFLVSVFLGLEKFMGVDVGQNQASRLHSKYQ